VLCLAMGAGMIRATGRVDLQSAVLLLGAVAAASALLPGKLAATWPYAAEIEQHKGLRFYAPFNEIYVPFEDISRVEWSWLRASWVIRLKRRRALLTGFNIHVAWGRQGRELADAIGEVLTES
jgi:hypothetical protein